MSSSSSSRINSSKSSRSGGGGGGGSGGSGGGSSGYGGSGEDAPPPPAAVSSSRPTTAPARAFRSRSLLVPGTSAAHPSSTSHARIVRHNSLRFRHDEPAWYEDSSFSGDSQSRGSTAGMEVMDLRPSSHHAVRHMETSSLVSLGSKSSSSISSSRSMSKLSKGGAKELTELKFTKLPSSLFNVKSGGKAAAVGGDGLVAAAESGDDGLKGGGDDKDASDPSLLKGDMPTHWEEADGPPANEEGDGSGGSGGSGNDKRHAARRPAQARNRSSLSLRISNNGKFLLGESEQAYRALMSLMSGGADDDGDHDNDDASKQGSLKSHGSRKSHSSDSHRSGYWSELGSTTGHGSHHGSDGTCTSKLTETSPLTREKRRQLRRKLYVRRCVQAIAAAAALAALSGSALYFGGAFGNDYLGKLLSKLSMGEESNEVERDEEETERRLRYGHPTVVMEPTEETRTDGHRASSGGKLLPPHHRDDNNYYNAVVMQEQQYFLDAAPKDVPTNEEWIGWIDRGQDQIQEYNQDDYPFGDEGRRALAPGEEGRRGDHFVPQGWN